ncbi:Hypothetical predicted protein [Pelobates cultripes]|uniref:Uncharacterized protein n=1 Tax=Pelobates cultripes TaxID=61616 RepID=A0AAD1VMZ2_PELCU|nr:Hypothetical predicted protein [Pelobates cultripes]
MAAAMATNADLLTLTTTIQDALRAEMAGIHTEVATHTGRIQALEHSSETQSARHTATDNAIARQGELILHMRRHLEDLDNRGLRCNIRLRGIQEAERGENAEEVLRGLFRLVLQADAPQKIEFERAHRALRPRSLEDGPRDMICCLHSFPVKDAIMRSSLHGPSRELKCPSTMIYPGDARASRT